MNEPMVRGMTNKELSTYCSFFLMTGEDIPQFVLLELLVRFDEMMSELKEYE